MPHRSVGGGPGDRLAAVVHRVQGAGEAVLPQAAESLVPHAAGPVAGTHHRDGGGGEQGAQRRALGGAVAQVDGALGDLVAGDVETHVDDAVVEPGPGACAQVAGHPEHGEVAGKHVSRQLEDPPAAGAGGEMLQQQSAYPPAAVWFGHEDRELRAVTVVADALAGGDTNQAITLDGGHRHVPVVLRLAEAVHLGAQRDGARQGEEAQTQRLGGGLVVESRQGPAVGAVNRPDGDDAAVRGQRVHAHRHGHRDSSGEAPR
jgi:hypothetical protein